MTSRNPFDDQPTLFSAMLTPHRSLNRVGFLVLMAFLSVISFGAGIAFLVLGAWPVFGFFGLDVLAVYLAFRVNFSRATAREEISVTPTALIVRRISHRGGVSEWSFNPLWVTLGFTMLRKSAEDQWKSRLGVRPSRNPPDTSL